MSEWQQRLRSFDWAELTLGYRPAVLAAELLPQVVAGDAPTTKRLCARMRGALELESSSPAIAAVLTAALSEPSASTLLFDPLLHIASELVSATPRAPEGPHPNEAYAAQVENTRLALAGGARALASSLSSGDTRPVAAAILGACGPHERSILDRMAEAAMQAPPDERAALWLALALASERADAELRHHVVEWLPAGSDEPVHLFARGLLVDDPLREPLHRVCLLGERVLVQEPAPLGDLWFLAASALAARIRDQRQGGLAAMARQTLERRIAQMGARASEDIVVACLASALQDVHLHRLAGRTHHPVRRNELQPEERELISFLARHQLRIAPTFGFPFETDLAQFLAD